MEEWMKEQYKETYTLTIGNGENHAGVFNDDNTITLGVVLKGYMDDKKAKKNDILERMLLMTGCIYEKTNSNYKDMYTFVCTKIKQLERLSTIIEKIYEDYDREVKVIIDQSCYDFFK